MALLSISAFAADAGYAARDVKLIHESGADSVHVDVMDGHFVTLTGLGDNWFEAMRTRITLPVDVHFMTLSPERFICRFAQYDPATIIFHAESAAGGKVERSLAMLADFGVRSGLALSPDSDVATIAPFLEKIDEVLVMTTQPGEPGSVFIPGSQTRIEAVRCLADKMRAKVVISVDGGLDAALAVDCIAHGAHKVIMGRSFFTNRDPDELARTIHNCQDSPPL